MSHHSSILVYLFSVIYGTGFGLFIFLQESVSKQQIAIPEKYLIIKTVVLSLLGGASSYSLQVQRKLVKSANWKDLMQNMLLSGFVASVIALIASGWVSDTMWLAAVLVSSFFKYFILALIPKVINAKIHQHLSLPPDALEVEDEET